MTSTIIAVRDIPVVDHDEAMVLAGTEYQRVLETIEGLHEQDWSRATPCSGWDVKAVLGHLLGMMKLGADPAELRRQSGEAMRRLEARGGQRIDHLTALHVEEHARLSTDELSEAIRTTIPAALAGRTARNDEERARPYIPGPPYPGEWTVGYLFDILQTRDPWLHRVADIAEATGRPPTLTAAHDGRLVADVVADWARRHGRPFQLRLTGPAGGAFVQGDGGDDLEVDAVQFCRILSGRAEGEGLLTWRVPF